MSRPLLNLAKRFGTADLRFKDLVYEIAQVRALFDQLALTASQIELRKVHSEQKELCKSVEGLKR
jgi:hypothetical protein